MRYRLLPLLALLHVAPSTAELTAAAGAVTTARELQQISRYQEKVQSRLAPRFAFAGVDWPPSEISLVAFKDTRKMELWASSIPGEWRHIKDYRIKGLSGVAGPKLKEGDRQVPEGFYRIESLNPNSRFHLSLKLNYPNAFDLQQAELERRGNLGGNIFIHGKDVSRGCLAIGDNSVEELFVLAGLIGPEAVSVLISPRDFRYRPLSSLPQGLPDWSYDLSRDIARQLADFPLSEKL